MLTTVQIKRKHDDVVERFNLLADKADVLQKEINEKQMALTEIQNEQRCLQGEFRVLTQLISESEQIDCEEESQYPDPNETV